MSVPRPGIGIKARAVVLDREESGAVLAAASDNDVFFRHASAPDPVLYGVLHNGLERQRGQTERGVFKIIFHLQFVAVPHGLHGQIGLRMPKLVRKDNGLCGGDGREIGLQISGKAFHHLHRLPRIVPAENIDRGQRVVNKVRPDLLHHGPDFRVLQLRFPFAQDPFLSQGPAYEAEALNKQVDRDPGDEKRRVIHGTGQREHRHIQDHREEKQKAPQQFRTGRFS